MAGQTFQPYPFRFQPIYKDKVWGGNALAKHLKRPLPPGRKVGESWEISWLGDDISRVTNGPYEGRLLSDLATEFPKEFLGTEVVHRYGRRFPLLCKLIDAAEPISLQVHPPDGMAARLEDGPWGKTEAWYVLWTEPGAQVICGLKEGINRENLPRLVANKQIGECVESLDAKVGDTIFIPAGRVHGTKGHVVLLEVQQNSDITYRLYDWDRLDAAGKPRALQVDKALQAVNYADDEETLCNPIVSKRGDIEERLLMQCDQFMMEKVHVPLFYRGSCDRNRFVVLFVALGRGEICPRGYANEGMAFAHGDFMLLPASMGDYEIQTDTTCDLIKVAVS